MISAPAEVCNFYNQSHCNLNTYGKSCFNKFLGLCYAYSPEKSTLRKSADNVMEEDVTNIKFGVQSAKEL